MPKHKIKKSIAVLLTATLTGTMLPCGAANLVPFNPVKPVVPQSVPVTKPLAESKPSSDGFSVQSVKSKINDIIKPQKAKPKLQDIIDHGTCGDNVNWQLDSDYVLTISGTGKMTDYQKIEDAPWNKYQNIITSIIIENGVESIGTNSFFYCTSLESVSISDSVKIIGMCAFEGCAKLNFIKIPDEVETIGDYAFQDCMGFDTVELGKNITNFGNNSFNDCGYITNIIIHSNNAVAKFANVFGNVRTVGNIKISDGVTLIKENSFKGCKNLKDTQLEILSEDLSEIEIKAFYNCDGLGSLILNNNCCFDAPNKFKNIFGGLPIRSITIGEKITIIPDEAFEDCTNFNEIIISDSVTSIGKKAFFDCKGIESITLNSCAASSFKLSFDSFDNIKEIKISDTVTSIGENSFTGVDLSNAKLILPSKDELVISDNAFVGAKFNSIVLNNDRYFDWFNKVFSNTTIPTIIIGEDLPGISKYAFSGRTDIESVILPDNDGFTFIGLNAFNGCSSLKNIDLSKIKSTIGESAFKGCSSLEFNKFSSSLKEIDESAFEGCTNLTEINIPNDVASIGDNAFKDCSKIEKLILNNCMVNNFNNIFSDSSTLKYTLKEIGFTDNVNNIPNNLFKGFSYLETININKVNEIGDSAFEGCSKLSSIDISNITTIGSHAFDNCCLININIPAGVTTIGEYAFSNCSNLESVKLSKCDNFSFDDAFKNSYDSLGTIEISDVDTIGEGLFKGCKFKDGNINILIPESVTTLGESSFENCNLNKIDLPNVTTIGKSAFNACSNLNNVTLPNVTTIETNAFEGCTSLTKLDLQKVTSIRASAFESCSNLSSIDISKVTTIGTYAFRNCGSLTEIDLSSVEKFGETEFPAYAFQLCSGLKTVKLNEYAVSKFLDNFYDDSKKLEKIIIADGTKTIKAQSFENGGWITAKFTIPNSVTTIESKAFLNCSGLTSIDIPNSVTTIESEAFSNCSGLTSIDIPENVKNIGENAFYGCTNINSITINNAYVLGNFASIFPNRTNLNTVILGNNVGETIPANTFEGCSNLNSVSIGDNIKSIGESAFSDCVGLNRFRFLIKSTQ